MTVKHRTYPTLFAHSVGLGGKESMSGGAN